MLARAPGPTVGAMLDGNVGPGAWTYGRRDARRQGHGIRVGAMFIPEESS
jgi:hypothetical protein